MIKKISWIYCKLSNETSVKYQIYCFQHKPRTYQHKPGRSNTRHCLPHQVSSRDNIDFVMNRCFINSLSTGRCGCYLKLVIFKPVWRMIILSISGEIVLKWMPQDLTDDKSTLVQVMAWCHQATSHYLNQCCSRSLLPYSGTRPKGVKALF